MVSEDVLLVKIVGILNALKMSNKILAIVGMCGAGKSVVSDFFVERGYEYLRFGQITLDKVMEITGKKESNPELEKEIRESLRKEHGMAAYAVANKPKLDSLLERNNVVVDGLYSWSEWKFLKEEYGSDLNVLAVMTSPENRYSRLEARTEVDEDMKNRPISRKDAMKRDYNEIENIEKGGPIAMADICVVNNGTQEYLLNQLEDVFRR